MIYNFLRCVSKIQLCVTDDNMSRKEALSHFIQQIHGRPVVVKLNNGTDYRGQFRVMVHVILKNSEVSSH